MSNHLITQRCNFKFETLSRASRRSTKCLDSGVFIGELPVFIWLTESFQRSNSMPWRRFVGWCAWWEIKYRCIPCKFQTCSSLVPWLELGQLSWGHRSNTQRFSRKCPNSKSLRGLLRELCRFWSGRELTESGICTQDYHGQS